MKFDYVKKIAGILGNKEKQLADAQLDVIASEALHEIQGHKHWPIIGKVFNKFYSEAVSELGKRNIDFVDFQRINNRVELLHDFEGEFNAIKARGEKAQAYLDKLQEKEKKNV